MLSLSSLPRIPPGRENRGNSNEHLRHDEYRIALYYCYVAIERVEEHVDLQKEACDELGLKGRIRVSPEGLNGVLSGCYSRLQVYARRIGASLPVLEEAPIDIKYCMLRTDLSVESQLFASLSVKATREVVSLYEPTPQDAERRNPIVDEENRNYYRRRRRNRQKHEQHHREQQHLQLDEQPVTEQSGLPTSPSDSLLSELQPSPHLTPEQWNERLKRDSNAIIVDARNVYESRVGYFQAPTGAATLLTNTRKYSSLPQVLQSSQKELAGKNVYMYCTGGVRCERASVLLQAMEWDQDKPRPTQIYQLQGGIQRYLERFGSLSSTTTTTNEECLFRGKNFVFDPRRIDPLVGRSVVGTCLLCHDSHDDYDNGKAPCENKETRCCKCRVLVLVCATCRPTVRACGEVNDSLRPLFCGGDDCIDEGNSIGQARLLLVK